MTYGGAPAPRLLDTAGIGATLRAEASRLGCRVLDNTLLDAGDGTAQISHILLDRFGMLLIKVQRDSGCIVGRSDDEHWTAKPEGRKKQRFRNPLRQNDLNRQILHRVLIASGRNIPVEYVQSLVVFVNADLSGLRLSDIDSMRVICPPDLPDFVRARYDFPPNHGAMDEAEIADLSSYLNSVDRSNDPDAVARHSDYTALSNSTPLLRRPKHHASATTPSIATQVIFKGADHYPDGTSNPLSKPRTSTSLLLQLLVAVSVVAVAVWLLIPGSAQMVRAAATNTLYRASLAVAEITGEPPSRVQPPASASTSAGDYDVPLALQRLREAAPDIYAGLTNPSSPRMSRTNGLPTYTWTYMQARSGGQKQLEAISVTLGPQGQIVGVGRGSR